MIEKHEEDRVRRVARKIGRLGQDDIYRIAAETGLSWRTVMKLKEGRTDVSRSSLVAVEKWLGQQLRQTA